MSETIKIHFNSRTTQGWHIFMTTKLGLEGSRDPADKVGTSETETWAAETKTKTEANEIRCRGRPRARGRSSRPPSLLQIHLK